MTLAHVVAEKNINSAAEDNLMIITGFHSIEEKIRSSVLNKNKSDLQKIKIYYSKVGPRVKKILELTKESEISSQQVLDTKLDSLVSSLDDGLKDHRGIVMEISESSSSKENSLANNIVDFDSWLKMFLPKETYSFAAPIPIQNISYYENYFDNIDNLESAKELAKRVIPTKEEITTFYVGNAQCTVANRVDRLVITLDSSEEFICYSFE